MEKAGTQSGGCISLQKEDVSEPKSKQNQRFAKEMQRLRAERDLEAKLQNVSQQRKKLEAEVNRLTGKLGAATISSSPRSAANAPEKPPHRQLRTITSGGGSRGTGGAPGGVINAWSASSSVNVGSNKDYSQMF